MLIEKSPTTNDVVSLKISNGDEIIGRIADINDASVTITKPMMMILSQDRNGNPGIQMVPFWMLGGDKDTKHVINRSHIVCLIKAGSEAVKGYTAHTSGLAIPSSGLIT